MKWPRCEQAFVSTRSPAENTAFRPKTKQDWNLLDVVLSFSDFGQSTCGTSTCHANLTTMTYLACSISSTRPCSYPRPPSSQSSGAKPLLSSSSTPTTIKPEAVKRTSATAKVHTGRVKSSVSRKSGSDGTTLPPTERAKRSSSHSVTEQH